MKQLALGLVPSQTPLRPLLWGLTLILALSSTAKIQLSENVLSRAAAMLAITENHRLELGPWKSLTVDWARTPEGSYFSNKAPGPILLGAVFFYPLYKAGKVFLNSLQLSDREKQKGTDILLTTILWILSLFLQLLPMVWFVSRTLILLQEKKAPLGALVFFLVGALFSNTGAFFLNSYFGHGFSLAATLGVFYFLLQRSFSKTGFFLGLAVMGDYSCFFLIPAVGVYLFVTEFRLVFNATGQVLKGLVFPMVLMGIYHWLCFGSPLALPQKFQNPSMVWDTGKQALWGVITFIPSNYTLWELTVGSRKGILVTQPYALMLLVLLGAAFPIWGFHKKLKENKIEMGLSLAALLFFAGVFCMNAGFNAWWGGGTPGPRYLSAAFVPLILAGSLMWSSWPKLIRSLLLAGLGIAFVFSLLSLAVGDLPSMEPLWSFMVWKLTDSKDWVYLNLRLIFFTGIVLFSAKRTQLSFSVS